MKYHLQGDGPSPFHCDRLKAIRLANAWWNTSGGRGIRFIAWDDIIDLGQDKFHVELVMDAKEDAVITVEGLVQWLPEDLRKQLLW